MKSFWNFFTGTTGVIVAIMLCGLCSLIGCIASFVASSGAVIAIAGTPIP